MLSVLIFVFVILRTEPWVCICKLHVLPVSVHRALHIFIFDKVILNFSFYKEASFNPENIQYILLYNNLQMIVFPPIFCEIKTVY